MIKTGYPLNCYKCGSTDLNDITIDRIDYTPLEIETFCKECGTSVAYWAHGQYLDGRFQ